MFSFYKNIVAMVTVARLIQSFMCIESKLTQQSLLINGCCKHTLTANYYFFTLTSKTCFAKGEWLYFLRLKIFVFFYFNTVLRRRDNKEQGVPDDNFLHESTSIKPNEWSISCGDITNETKDSNRTC